MSRKMSSPKLGIPQEQINAALKALREKGERVVMAAKSALAEGVKETVEDAKSRCPVKTGKLRDSIKATDIAEGAMYEITADAENEKGERYGKYVEYSPRINQPFLYPAIEANAKKINDKVKAAIKAG